MSEILIKSVQDLNEAIVALRTANEKKDGESKATVEKIQTALDKQEEKNQELIKEMQEKNNQLKEIESKLLSITSASNYNSQNPQLLEEVKSYESFLANGKREEKYLRTDVSYAGGVFVPEIRLQGIIKNITEISNIRPFATVRTMSAKSESMPVRSGSVVAYMTGEGEPTTESQPSYGDMRLEAKKMTAKVSVSTELLQDSVEDAIAEMNLEVAEKFAYLEGSQILNGTGGANNIQGIMTNSDISFIESGDANNITFDSLIKITGEIKTGYNPIYVFNRKTLAALRLLKQDNKYIWEAGNLGVNTPANINGLNYVIMPDMPDIGAGTFPILFGDFRNLVIGDRKALTVIRDEITLASSQLINFIYHRRLGAIVTKTEAFKKIKIANS